MVTLLKSVTKWNVESAPVPVAVFQSGIGKAAEGSVQPVVVGSDLNGAGKHEAVFRSRRSSESVAVSITAVAAVTQHTIHRQGAVGNRNRPFVRIDRSAAGGLSGNSQTRPHGITPSGHIASSAVAACCGWSRMRKRDGRVLPNSHKEQSGGQPHRDFAGQLAIVFSLFCCEFHTTTP